MSCRACTFSAKTPIAQFIIEKISNPEVLQTHTLPTTKRGDHGFGSTTPKSLTLESTTSSPIDNGNTPPTVLLESTDSSPLPPLDDHYDDTNSKVLWQYSNRSHPISASDPAIASDSDSESDNDFIIYSDNDILNTMDQDPTTPSLQNDTRGEKLIHPTQTVSSPQDTTNPPDTQGEDPTIQPQGGNNSPHKATSHAEEDSETHPNQKPFNHHVDPSILPKHPKNPILKPEDSVNSSMPNMVSFTYNKLQKSIGSMNMKKNSHKYPCCPGYNLCPNFFQARSH